MSETDSRERVDVSVILPIYNERDHLGAEITRVKTALESSPYAFEIIAVDDGSTDGSLAALREIPDIRVLSFSENRGVGTARRAGSQLARGDVIVWTDVDMSYPNDEIPRLVKELEGHDQVVGARRSEEGTARLLRRPAKWFIRRLASYLVRTPIPDLNSGLRAFRREIGEQFLHLLPRGFSCVTTMTMTFLAHGYSVRHVPIDYFPRAGRSKFHWWADTKNYATQVIRMVLSYEPLRIFLPLGVFLTLLGTGKLVYDWIGKDFHLATNTLLVFFTAFQIIAIGFLADLVVRVNKPRDLRPPVSMIERDSTSRSITSTPS